MSFLEKFRRPRDKTDGSVSPYDIEFHLTPSGWVRGSECFLGIVQAEVIPPPARVLTRIKRLIANSGSAENRIEWHTTWCNSAMAQFEIDELLASFPLAERPVVETTFTTSGAEEKQAPIVSWNSAASAGE